ncbi:MAG: AzlD domain-containing protein [Acidimicrobiales bacterium]
MGGHRRRRCGELRPQSRRAGPAFLGERQLPDRANRVISLLPSVLLSALVVTDVAGQRWSGLSWPVLAGLAATAGSRLLRAPALGAVAIGVVVTAGLRLITRALGVQRGTRI